MKKTFISYSHADVKLKKRFETHIAQLVRDKIIGNWSDETIDVGGHIDSEVFARLEDSDLYIALLSPDFLASPYCFEKEFPKAIELYHAGKLRIIPIILEPCDWLHTPFAGFKAAPPDGKPISTSPNENEAFAETIRLLRRLLMPVSPAVVAPAVSAKAPEPEPQQQPQQPGFKVKRHFDAVDKETYKNQAYAIIRDYFRKLIDTLNTVPNLKAVFSDMGASSFTCTVVNNALQGRTTSITVHMGEGSGMGDIYYSMSARAAKGSANGIYSIRNTDYQLHMTTNSLSNYGSDIIWEPINVASDIEKRLLTDAGIERS